MQLEVIHDSIYTYEGQVETVRHLAHLKPPSTHTQKIINSKLIIDPQPDLYQENLDIYNNFASYFSIQEKHSKLKISSISQLETYNNQLQPFNNSSSLHGRESEIISLIRQIQHGIALLNFYSTQPSFTIIKIL